MRTTMRATALIAAASLLGFGAVAQAATPSQADFDACNKEAQARASSPAASPGGTGSGDSSSPRAGTGSAPPQSASGGASGSPGASGGTSSSVGSSGTDSGSPSASGGTSGPGGTGASGSTSGGVSGSASADQQLQGMASSGANDPAYQQAYRDCMKRRGF